jgi:hypothetical protein
LLQRKYKSLEVCAADTETSIIMNHELRRVLDVVTAYGIGLGEEILKILSKNKQSLAQGFEPGIF